MLKKIEQTGHETAASKSVVKELRASLLKYSKFAQEQIEILFPKKGKVVSYKIRAGEDHRAEHVVVDKELHFIFIVNKCFPLLKTIHQYPDMYPRFTADEGAIKFLIKGANVMCPGLTSEGASMEEVDEGIIVSIYVKNHEHCVGLGITAMSTDQIKKVNEGIAVELVHYVGDGLWNLVYCK